MAQRLKIMRSIPIISTTMTCDRWKLYAYSLALCLGVVPLSYAMMAYAVLYEGDVGVRYRTLFSLKYRLPSAETQHPLASKQSNPYWITHSPGGRSVYLEHNRQAFAPLEYRLTGTCMKHLPWSSIISLECYLKYDTPDWLLT